MSMLTPEMALADEVRAEWRPAARPEAHYRDLLVAQRGGITEVKLPFGRADAWIGAWIVEVEPFATWRQGVRQALAYAAMTPWPRRGVPRLRPALATYGEIGSAQAIDLYIETRDWVRLFLFRDGHWEDIVSRRAANRRWTTQ